MCLSSVPARQPAGGHRLPPVLHLPLEQRVLVADNRLDDADAFVPAVVQVLDREAQAQFVVADDRVHLGVVEPRADHDYAINGVADRLVHVVAAGQGAADEDRRVGPGQRLHGDVLAAGVDPQDPRVEAVLPGGGVAVVDEVAQVRRARPETDQVHVPLARRPGQVLADEVAQRAALDHQPGADQCGGRLPHGHAVHTVPLGQLPLGGQPRPGAEGPVADRREQGRRG